MKLNRTKQCAKCPWRVDVDPNEIPNGYSREKHAALERTIAEPGDVSGLFGGEMHVMACHETGRPSWLVSVAASMSRDGCVAVGAEDFKTCRRIVAANDRSHGLSGPLRSVRTAIPVDVVYFKERYECFGAAPASASQHCDERGASLIAIAPRGIGRVSAIDIVLAGRQLPLSDFGLLPLESPVNLRRWFGTVGVGQLTSAGFAARGATISAFAVRAEFIERLRGAAEGACFHQVIVPQTHCVGWLMNQLGPGNNIALRFSMRHCENIRDVKLVGDQHQCFEDTLSCK